MPTKEEKSNILLELSESELNVYEYIKQKTANSQGLKESMKQIGLSLSLSEATVHRCVTKLRKYGIVGIIPSTEKTISNEIIFYGDQDPEEQVADIYQMIGQLSSSTKRFEAILQLKQKEIDEFAAIKAGYIETIEALKLEINTMRLEKSGLNSDNILSTKKLDEFTTAYIIKN